jgi:hypothetical protein
MYHDKDTVFKRYESIDPMQGADEEKYDLDGTRSFYIF